MKKYNKEQIDCGLNIGKIYTGSKIVLLYLGVFLPLLIPLATIGIIITINSNLINSNNTIVVSLIFINILAIFITTVCLIKLIHNNKNILKIESCLSDAIEIKAVVRRIDLESIKYKPYQVEISYKLNDKQYKKISPAGNPIKGYNKYFLKYCGREIHVLYSVIYDEIMFLK